jgi:hypothetical protein
MEEESAKISRIAIPWYTKKTYPHLLEIFEDSHKLPSTYGEWLAAAQGLRKHLEARGNIVVAVHLDPYKFTVWCIAQGIKLDVEARQKFVTEHVNNNERKYT